jgi:ribonuclease D
MAQALVRTRAQGSGVAVDLIATQADLAALVGALLGGRDAADVRVTQGWRRELVGEELIELLAGRLSLRVRDGRVEVAE